jgi:DUF2075 family protein
MEIKKYPFNQRGLEIIDGERVTPNMDWPKNWPVVYIITGADEAYIGETNKINFRIKQHLQNEERKKLSQIYIIIDDTYNKSAIHDMESSLIKYISSENTFKLQNGNNGLIANAYYDKQKYLDKFENELWPKLKDLNIVKNDLKNIQNSDRFKYSPYNVLGEQQYETVIKILIELLDNWRGGNKVSFIVNGGAGTGKTILGVYLMKLLTTPIEDDENIETAAEYNSVKLVKTLKNVIKDVALVIPQKSLRKTLKNVFRDTYGLNSDMVISPNDVIRKKYDLLIVDEAHRLRRRKNLTNYKIFDDNNRKLDLSSNSTELDWIIKQSKYQIFFYDRNQSIKPTDIEASDFSNKINVNKHYEYVLCSQFRVLAGPKYIDYIYGLFNCDIKEKINFPDYEFRLIKDMADMNKLIIKKDLEHGLSRMVAGYSWKWKSKENLEAYDIEIDGIKFKWNTESEDWINSPNSLHEIGCIHTIQGYDLNYVGVIIGKEISYDESNNQIIVKSENYFDTKGKVGITNPEELKQFIKNIYCTLLTRGMRGTYIYVCDEKLREYLEKYIDY